MNSLSMRETTGMVSTIESAARPTTSQRCRTTKRTTGV